MLISLFGTKALGVMLWLQDAAAAGQETGTADHFTLTEMVKNMGGVAISVVIVLLIMSVYSIAIMVERYLTYSAAKKQSREFAPRVAQALKNDRIE
jgi:biopolymer transport protein ExbB/biopolymer transport protein TolQ